MRICCAASVYIIGSQLGAVATRVGWTCPNMPDMQPDKPTLDEALPSLFLGVGEAEALKQFHLPEMHFQRGKVR